MPTLDTVVKVANTVALLQPQLAVILQLVQAGFIGVQTIRAFYKSQGHDDETLDAIVKSCDAHIARWQTTTF